MKEQYNVVIVDDNQSLSYLIRDNLAPIPEFNVCGIAHDGQEGIQLINKIEPDIVILDIIMPKTDGLAVLEYFQNNEEMSFIILSAIGHDLITKRAMSLGAVYYLVKPFEIQTLIQRLTQLFLSDPEETSAEEIQFITNLEETVSQEIKTLGIPMHVKGYQYIKEAVKMAVHAGEGRLKITKEVYPKIAKENGTTPTSVERAIRNAIDLTISRGSIDFIQEYFNHELFNNKITNKEFILRIANAVKRNI